MYSQMLCIVAMRADPSSNATPFAFCIFRFFLQPLDYKWGPADSIMLQFKLFNGLNSPAFCRLRRLSYLVLLPWGAGNTGNGHEAESNFLPGISL